MKLNSKIAGAGIGGGASALTQIAVRMGKTSVRGDGTSKVRTAIADNPGAVGLLVGAASAGGLYAAKKKDAAIGAILSAAAVSAVGIVLDYRDKKALEAAAARLIAAGPPTSKGYGLMVAQQAGFGAAPNIEILGFGRADVEILGQSQPQQQGGAIDLKSFGGASF